MKKLLLFLLIFVVPAVGQTTYNREKEWEKEIGTFLEIDKKQTPPANAVLFTGSSSIRLWASLRSDFPKLAVINRGFGGSRLEDLVHYAPQIVLPYRPKTMVVYSGENDIEAGQPAEDALADFKAFIDFRDKELPKTPVFYISMKPSVLRWKLWPEMKKGNELIRAEAAKHKNVTFVDVSEKMLGADGMPMLDIFGPDGLHMNEKGYAIWRSILAPLLK